MRVSGFLLLEVMLAVAVFAIGVLSLGECVNHCLTAESARKEDQLAHDALRDRLRMIESGAYSPTTNGSDQLEDRFASITMQQSFQPLQLKNENNQPISNLYSVHLEAHWQSGSQAESKAITFYVFQKQPPQQ